MTRTGRVPRLTSHQREPCLDIHPDDADRLGLAAGGFSRIESEYGHTVLPVRIMPAQRRGEVFAPMHWTDAFTSAGPIGRIVAAATDPVSGQPELKLTPVSVAPIAPLWRGLVLRRSANLPDGSYYWARVPLSQGQAFDLAGWAPLPSGRGTERWVLDLLGAPANPELVVYADPARGIFRYASLIGGRLDACLLLARNTAGLPPREAFEAWLGAEMEPALRGCVLSGQAPGAEPAGGRTICACFGVGLQTLHEAIIGSHLRSVAEIGTALRAGTNCGSCLPELKVILHEAMPERVGA